MVGAGSRPAPLLLGALPQRELVLPDWFCEVPVRRTFIDYRCPEESPRLSLSRSLSGLSTAPASLAGSVRESLDEVTSCPVRSLQSLTSDAAREQADAGSAASSARRSMASSASTSATLPLVSYRMSPISARAAGLMQERLDRADAKTQIDKCAEAEVGRVRSSGSTDEDCESSGDEDDDEDLGLCPIYKEGAALPSAGSAGHADGSCRRCCFFPKGRCNNGEDCQFCHFAHEKRKGKAKKKKSKKRSGRRGRPRQDAAAQDHEDGKTDGSPTVAAPVNIVLQDAIPLEDKPYQPPSYMAFVPVPFCVGVY